MSSSGTPSFARRVVAVQKDDMLKHLKALYKVDGTEHRNTLSLHWASIPEWPKVFLCLTFERSGVLQVSISERDPRNQTNTRPPLQCNKSEAANIDCATLALIQLQCDTCKVKLIAEASFNKAEPINVLPFYASTWLDKSYILRHSSSAPSAHESSSAFSLPSPTQLYQPRVLMPTDPQRDIYPYGYGFPIPILPSFKQSRETSSMTVLLELAPLCAPHTPLQSRLLQRMLEESVLPDVVLRVGRQELRAHRAVLAASSPVFRGMFQHEGFLESQLGEVAIEGVRPKVMEAALGFLYGRQQQVAADTDTLVELLVLAERYQLPELKAECEGLLAYDWSVDLLKLLALADTHNAAILKSVVMKRVSQHPDRKELLGTPAAREFIASHPNVISELFSMI